MGFWQRVPYLFAFIRNTVILLYSAFCLIIIYKREVSIRHPLLNMFIIPFISPSHCLRLVLEAQMIIAIHYIFNVFPIPFTEYGNQKVHLMIVYVIKIELINLSLIHILLLTHAPEYGNNGVIVLGDVAVTPVPDANQLAQIAVCTAQTAKAVAGIDPRVAMLSFSTKGSAKHEVVDKVVEALAIAKEMAPDLKIDGELQADAALVPHIGASKAPGSEIAGKANVLVVPCLEVGNISYKLVERLGHATAIGPILQGIARPVNDLSRGCSIDDVYKMIAITANQAIAAKENK